VCVVSEQYLSIRINEAFQPSSLKNARQSRFLGQIERVQGLGFRKEAIAGAWWQPAQFLHAGGGRGLWRLSLWIPEP
jgi:hypothetical protein